MKINKFRIGPVGPFALTSALVAALLTGCKHKHGGMAQNNIVNTVCEYKNIIDAPLSHNGIPLKKAMFVMLYIGEIHGKSSGIDKVDEETHYKKILQPQIPFKIKITVNGGDIYNGQLLCDYFTGLSGSFAIRSHNDLLRFHIEFPEDRLTFDETVNLSKGLYLIISKEGDEVTLKQFMERPMFE